MSDIINTEAVDAIESTANTTTKYTLDYVLEQIENLQKQLTENSFHSLHRLEDAVYHIYETDSESGQDEDRNTSVACVCAVFRNREETLQRMLAFYEKMYDDLKPKAKEPMEPVLKTFTDMLELDKAVIKPEYRERIMQQMVEYAEKLKAKTLPSPEEQQNKLEKMSMLLDSLHKCTNDSAASYIGEELHRLMND